MKTLLILNASHEAVPGIQKAKKMGLKIVVADKNKFAPGFKYADYKIYESIYNYTKLVKITKKFNDNTKKIDGVIAMASDTPIAVARIAKKLNLKSNSIKSSILSTNKLMMKDKLKNANIKVPWYSEIKNFKHLQNILKNKKEKYIIKPIDNRGSRGVLQIDKNSDLLWSYNYCLKNSKKKKVMIEKFLNGKQISSESIIYGEKSFTPGMIERNYEYLNKFKPHVIENGGQQPVNLSEKNLKRIAKITVMAGRCLGIKYGTVKGDIVFHKGEPYIIEIATRLSGGWMSSDQIYLGTGIDFLKYAIKIALGEKINIDNLKIKQKYCVAIRYFFPKPGTLFNIKKKIKKNKFIKKFMIFRNNSSIKKITDHTIRPGFVITVAKEKQKAILEANKFIQKILKS